MARQCVELTAAVAVCLFFIATVQSATEIISAGPAVPRFRLPNDTIPLKYRLHIVTEVHRSLTQFSGSVEIEILAKNRTNQIVLHASKLTEFEVSVKDLESGEDLPNVTFVTETSFLLIFGAPQPFELNPGKKYIVTVNYTGSLAARAEGFHLAESYDSNDEIIPIATTQFEPVYARLAFPCYDEPALKAHFELSITHGSNYSAISNMPVVGPLEPSPDGSLTTTRFKQTPLMSTYLLAFVVSNYDHFSSEANGVNQTVYYPPGMSDNVPAVVNNAINSLTAFEDYFGVKYPLEKLDHAFVSVSYGLAMENWGLITYSANFLDFNLSSHSELWTLKRYHITQNHEIAHQWFGNLVSPKLWTYAWLNEAFATYYSYVIADSIFPELKLMEVFEGDVLKRALTFTENTKPSSYPVKSDTEAREAFDEIAYIKTPVIVGMFHHAMGKKAFDKGLTTLFNRFQYSSADEDDLFQCLQESVNEDGNPIFRGEGVVNKIMSSWTHNGLFPVVTITRNYTSGTITIKQKPVSPVESTLWWIPLTFATASSPDFNDTRANYVMPNVEEVTIDLKDLNLELQPTDWLIVNVQQTGLYQVVYDDQNWHLIAKALNENPKAFPRTERALLFKQMEFGLSNYDISIEPVMELLNYSRHEDDLYVWSSVVEVITLISDGLHGSKSYESFKSFTREIIESIFKRVSNLQAGESSSVMYETSRYYVLDTACRAELPLCLSIAHKATVDEVVHKKPMNVSELTKVIVFEHGLSDMDGAEFEDMWNNMTSTQRMFAFGEDLSELTGIRNPVIVEKILKKCAHDPVFTRRFFFSTFRDNWSVRGQLIDFLLENYERIITKDTDRWITGFTHAAPVIHKQDTFRKKFIELIEKIDVFLQNSDEKLPLMETNETVPSRDIKTKILDRLGLAVHESDVFYADNEDAILNWIREHKQATGRNSVQIGPKSIFAASLLPFVFRVI